MSFSAGSQSGPVHIIAKAFDDLRIDALSVRNGATAPTLAAGFAGNANLYYSSFSNTGTEIIYFPVQFPHATKVGSVCYPHVHIAPVTTGTGNVRFRLEYSKANYPGVFGVSATYDMEVSIASPNQWSHIIASGTDGIVTQGMSEVWQCRIIRDNSVAGNLAAAVALQYFDIHYEVDALGSSYIYIK